jgi:ribosomal protein RSM22 (predicted rRNA methylase)
MKAPTVKVDPVMEAIAKALFGIESVIALNNHHGRIEAKKMIARAVKEARQASIEYVDEKARDNAGKFISDRAMEAFIAEVTK